MLASVPIIEELIKARKEQGLSQTELADLCTKQGYKLHQKDISWIESRRHNPTSEKLEAIAKALGKEWRLD